MNQLEPQNTISVVIVEDHPLFRDGLRTALEMEQDLRVIGQSADGLEGLKVVRKLQPDVALIDVNLPSMNGIQLTRQLKSAQVPTRVIILTAYHEVEQVFHVMRSGASAYFAKHVTPDRLIDAIRTVVKGLYIIGDMTMDTEQLEVWLSQNIEAAGRPQNVDGVERYVPLSRREMEVLESVTLGYSNKEIASQLKISQQTVKNHMTSILRKLNVEDRTQAAVTALRHGWVRIRKND